MLIKEDLGPWSAAGILRDVEEGERVNGERSLDSGSEEGVQPTSRTQSPRDAALTRLLCAAAEGRGSVDGFPCSSTDESER